MRPNAAGPVLETRHAQALGPHALRLGIRVHGDGGDISSATTVAAERFSHPMRTRVVRANPAGDLAATGEPLRLSLPPDAALTAFGATVDGRPELRVVNLSGDACRVGAAPEPWFADQAGITGDPRLVGLRGDTTGAAAGGAIDLAPWQIATLEW